MTYELHRFNPGETKPHRTWLIIGSRGTGKSQLLLDLLYHTRNKYDVAFAMTATTSTVDTLQKIIPKRFISANGYDFGKADTLLQSCKTYVAQGKGKRVLHILDDVMFEAGVMKSQTQKELHFNGRHALCTQMSTTQDCMAIPRNLRGNIDYIIALRENIVANKRRLYEYFFGLFSTFREFDRVFMQCTSNYGALVIDKTQPTASLANCLFYYKAQASLPTFKIGKPIFFAYSDYVDRLARKYHKVTKSPVKLIT